MARILNCEMESNCKAKVTHLDKGGFIYCAKHGRERRQYQPCRKLSAQEIKRLESGRQVMSY